MKEYKVSNSLGLVRSIRARWMAGVLVVGLMMTLAPVAFAGTIGISDGKLIVGTEPGDGNQVITASILGTDLLISTLNFDVVTPGCSGFGTVTCALSGFNELIVVGGDGDDVINLSAITAPTFATLILGEGGNDLLIGSGGDDTIFGGPGDDVLVGGPGQDCLNPGSGSNVVIQAAISCFDGPDPVITPLPRPTASVPEPGGVWLLGTGLGALAITKRNLLGRLTKGNRQRT
jgi:hypothetical protein